MAIKQHWVSQFYLRNFRTAKNNGKLWVTDIPKAYAGGYGDAKQNVPDVAYAEHLYSFASDEASFQPNKPKDGWDAGVDKFLQKIEAEAGEVWTRMREDPLTVEWSPGSDDRHMIAVFLASLHLRNPYMVAVAKYEAITPNLPPLITSQDREAFHRAVAAMPIDMSATFAGIQDRTAFRAAQSRMLPAITEVLEHLHWTVRYFPSNTSAGPLVTSDTPLFCFDRKEGGATNMESPDAVVWCPLTSRVLLVATGTRVDTPDGEVTNAPLEQANTANQHIAHFASKQVYSGFQLGADFPFLR